MRRSVVPLAVPMLLALAVPAVGQSETDVDVELVLAVDVSRSMDFQEQEVQRQGYADAFRHPQLLEAIAGGAIGRIAVTYIQWAGFERSETLVPWMVIDGADTAETFAQALEKAEISMWRGTSISNGLRYAAGRFDDNGYFGERMVIDVSGDGPNNMGAPVLPVRDAIIDRGITINGLPIMIRQSPTLGGYNIPNLDVYYEDCVIGGPGSFVVTVDETSQFAEAIRRKLVLEIAGLALPVVRVATARQPRIDCMIGEKLRQQRWLDP